MNLIVIQVFKKQQWLSCTAHNCVGSNCSSPLASLDVFNLECNYCRILDSSRELTINRLAIEINEKDLSELSHGQMRPPGPHAAPSKFCAAPQPASPGFNFIRSWHLGKLRTYAIYGRSRNGNSRLAGTRI